MGGYVFLVAIFFEKLESDGRFTGKKKETEEEEGGAAGGEGGKTKKHIL